MTPEQAETVSKRIHTEVMGECWHANKFLSERKSNYEWWACHECMKEWQINTALGEKSVVMPNYTTNTDAALRAAERAIAPYFIEIDYRHSLPFTISFWDISKALWERSYEGRGETLAEALCKAIFERKDWEWPV